MEHPPVAMGSPVAGRARTPTDMSEGPDLVLASASPRRRDLLESVGLVLTIRPAEIDESPLPGERPGDYVRRIARGKCDKVADALLAEAGDPLPVLGADTTVILDDEILGKPADGHEARAMLARLAGRRHEVTTACRIRYGARAVERAVTTQVSMRSLRPAELDAYVASQEWRGKAGGYALQGIAGAFVTELRGSHTNVIGLPLAEVLADLLALEVLPRYPRQGFGASSREGGGGGSG
jgi:septum formation protein